MCVAYAAARQLQVHRRRVGACVQGKIAGGFDRVKTYHQKFTAQVRRKKSARLVRAERALGEK